MQPAPFNQPLSDITKSGTYILKLIKPKDDAAIAKRFKWSNPDEAGKSFATCNLFFLGGDGLCLTQRFSVKYYTDKVTGEQKAGMALPMVVGKFSGTYAKAPSEDMSVEQLFQFVSIAFGRRATVEVEVTPNGEWNGKPQYRYRFKKITPVESVTYSAPAADESVNPDDLAPPTGEAIPF
jgi:hypothetical protein